LGNQPHDEAFLESMRTEQHPERSMPEVSDDVEVTLEKVYGIDNGRELMCDVFTPGVQPSQPRPAIVFLHGGSWLSGGPSQFHFHSGYLASKYGFFAISVDYRLSGEAQFPAALQDSKCAVRWVRSQAEEQNIDPNRVCVSGGSAGGHLTSMIATTAGIEDYEGSGGNDGFSSHGDLTIPINGEFDMWDLVEKGSLIDAMVQFIGGTSEKMPEKYDELSSVQRVTHETPPALLLHGTEDRCVSHEQSIAYAKALKAKGVHAEVELYEGKPHAWFNNEPDRTIVLHRMEKFLVEQFGLSAIRDS